MANYSAADVSTNTLGASVVDLVLLTTPASAIQVINESGTSPIFFTVSQPGGPCPVPTINGANCRVVAASAGAIQNVRVYGRYGSIVQLISAGSPQYSVVIGSRQISI